MSTLATGSGSGPPQGLHAGIPTGFTREQAQQMYQKWQQMKAQGMNQSNPEFARISQILRALQQNNTNANNSQQQQLLQQQQQQQQQGHLALQNMQQSRAQNNRLIPQTVASTQQPMVQNQNASSVASPTANNAGMTQAQVPASLGASSAPLPSAQSFTPNQLATLRHQIVAFKYISRNMSLPPPTQAAIFPTATGAQPIPGPSIAPNPQQVTDASPDVRSNSTEKVVTDKEVEEADFSYKTCTDPMSRLQPSISYADHGLRDKRLTIPSIFPTGVDITELKRERENEILAKIVSRTKELEDLRTNISSLSFKNDASHVEQLKVNALIELKGLTLLEKQRAFRFQVVEQLLHSELRVASSRSNYQKMKKPTMREARITEKLEKQQRDQKDQRERKKQSDYLNAVSSHAGEISRKGLEIYHKRQKLAKSMQTQHAFMEKEEAKRVERTAKQRLQALKANDEEAYLKLLDQAKDTRITHLLKQTDGFLNSLAQSVRQQQRDAVQHYGKPDGYQEESSDDDEDGDEEKKIDYMEVAHRIKETITEQPSILVGGKLKEYQVKGLQWMVSLYNNNLNGILADEMGLGKTIQTISLITFLIEKKRQNGPFLVIVPLSTLTNWILEFEKWAPSVAKIAYKGPPNTRKSQQAQIKYGNFQVLLTTYEYIIKDRPVLSKVKWNYMIVDEGHRMKNSQSKLSYTLTTYYNCRFRLILTGTPLQNNLPELWALLNFALPNIFKSVKSFDEWFNTPFANTGTQDKMELTEEESLLVIRRLHKVLRPFLLRRLKKDVEAELPDKKEEIIKCKQSALQQNLYSQVLNRGMLYVSGEGKGGKTAFKGLSNTIMQLRKVCNHPFVFEEVESAINPMKINNDLLWRTSGKFELLDRILPKFYATKHRVLMFFQMTQIMNIMEDFLHLKGYKYLRLDGSTKADDRSALLKQFNAPDSPYFMFLLSTRAGGLGLNLQTADTVIIYDSDWNPHQDLQAQDRAHRIGQKNEVRILRLITTNSVEEKILERAQYKLDIDGKVIQAGKFDNKSTNEERDALLRVMLESNGKGEGEGNEELDDEELNEILARHEDEIEIFKKIDQERAAQPITYTDRLFTEAELPEIYLQDPNVAEEEVVVPVGRGARERNNVKYDDGLTEEQWLDAMDDDEDTVEDAIRRKRDRIEKRQANKLKRQGMPDSTPQPETPPQRELSTPPPPTTQKRKRGRQPKPKDTPMKPKDADVEPDSVPKRKRPRAGKHDVLSPQERAAYQQIFNTVYDAVVNLQASDPDRVCSGPYMTLPSKKIYPDYYDFIKAPISFDIIRKKIDKEQYSSISDFKSDFLLMFSNARIYNEEGSLVYLDSQSMEAEFEVRLKQQLEEHSEVINSSISQEQHSVDGEKALEPNGSGSNAADETTTPTANFTPSIKLKFKNPSLAVASRASSSAQSPQSE